MLFNSYVFIFVFLPAVFFLFQFLLRTSYKQAVALLVIASLIYYAWWNVNFVFLILASLGFNFCVSRFLAHDRMTATPRKALLAAGVVSNLLLLGVFKYLGFFGGLLNDLGAGLSLPDLVLPIGISFFTFQQIAFLVDTYRGVTIERDFTSYALFVCFFPQLIAGPIVHHSEMLPQFKRRLPPRTARTLINVGLFVFTCGLAKKVWIADSLAVFADAAYNASRDGVALSFAEAWGGTLAYTFQIYFDFSGYSDMAVGLALMFGIRLPINFNSPYKARSIIDFWRRWHITLSRFLRDYLYIPLGGNRHGQARRWGSLMIVMLLGGLWHGAGLTYIVWGGLHGLYLMVNHAWRQAVPAPLAVDSRLRTVWVVGAWAITFLAVVLAWTFFRSASVPAALQVIRSMLMVDGISISQTLEPAFRAAVPQLGAWLRFDGFFHNGLADWKEGAGLISLAMFLAFACPNVLQIAQRYTPVLEASGLAAGPAWLRWRPTLFWAVVTGVLLAASVLRLSGDSPFLYFQF